MLSFEKAVQDTNSIPPEGKCHWITQMQAGDKRPVIALLFLRLHCLTSLVKVPKCREGLFILQTLQCIANLPDSSPLSPLRKVETHRQSSYPYIVSIPLAHDLLIMHATGV